MYEAGQKKLSGIWRGADLRLTGAFISRHWASPFHQPLSGPGHKMVHGSVPAVWNPRWAHDSEWVQAPSWELSNRIESFNTSTITHTLYLPVEFKHKWWFVHVYLLLGLMSSFRKVCMKISCSEQRSLYKQTKTFAVLRLPWFDASVQHCKIMFWCCRYVVSFDQRMRSVNICLNNQRSSSSCVWWFYCTFCTHKFLAMAAY